MATTEKPTGAAPPLPGASGSSLPAPYAAIADRLACPVCHARLSANGAALRCAACAIDFPVRDGIAALAPPRAETKPEAEAWGDHWSQDKQSSLPQRFFSFYRKAVFARTVAYFLDGSFAEEGVFLEAGSGTAETSQRVNKRGGRRILIALDLIGEVLKHCHPIMDVRIQGDIFRLPFRDSSLDGVWNVGVMEHFTWDQIDEILCEFHRILKPGAPVILLWPAESSIPQKILRLIEKVVNARRSGPRFLFHPDEISKLPSSAAARQILSRNGFNRIEVDTGIRSLMAFKTPVGRKSLTPVPRS
jgi:SAM-dependent methyltransferase